MTAADVDVTATGRCGMWITGLQPAGTTTLLHLAEELVADDLILTDLIMQSLLRTGTGVQS